jgi:hypothetical protein
MAIYGAGQSFDYTFKVTDELKTTTSQFKCVGIVPGTTTQADFTVNLCGVSNSIGGATCTAFHCIGINQSYLSSGSDTCVVRMFGISKVTCAESIPAGAFVMPYWGISTTTMPGRIVCIDDGVTQSAAGASIAAHCVVLGRALESGSTGTVISVFVNPHMYDLSFIGTIGIT